MEQALEIGKIEAARLRFEFGKNWSRYLECLNEERVLAAQNAIQAMLPDFQWEQKSVLDIGSGSGLSSLVMRRLGARVESFDYDQKSVNCTKALKGRFFANDPDWLVQQGSALDPLFMGSLSNYDLVYSWGVLHHTGEMERAIELASQRVKPGGKFFIALYNDQGFKSKLWHGFKKTYVEKAWARPFLLAFCFFLYGVLPALRDLLTLRNPIHVFSRYSGKRGMSQWHDIVDWAGGYPFEVATPEKVVDILRHKGFLLEKIRTCGGKLGCNEFVFTKTQS